MSDKTERDILLEEFNYSIRKIREIVNNNKRGFVYCIIVEEDIGEETALKLHVVGNLENTEIFLHDTATAISMQGEVDADYCDIHNDVVN